MATEAKKAGNQPIGIELEEGKTVFWCACGLSSKQPFCDGSHKGSDFNPKPFKAPKNGTFYFCACKQTNASPLCDGSHKN